MEKTLKPLVDQLVSLIQNGVDFVKGQIPDVAVQILHFKAAEALLNLIGADLLAATLIGLFAYFFNKARKRDWEGDGFCVLAVVFGISSVIVTIMAVANTYDGIHTLLEIHYAPKVFLLEYLKDILAPHP